MLFLKQRRAHNSGYYLFLVLLLLFNHTIPSVQTILLERKANSLCIHIIKAIQEKYSMIWEVVELKPFENLKLWTWPGRNELYAIESQAVRKSHYTQNRKEGLENNSSLYGTQVNFKGSHLQCLLRLSICFLCDREILVFIHPMQMSRHFHLKTPLWRSP